MHYIVRARLMPGSAPDFYRKLTDGSISSQEPDGEEIVESMHRAVIDPEGIVRWSEICYCPTPLEHERETVYDHFFTDLQTAEVEDYVHFSGEPLMESLEQSASAP